ncbi:hypothetical protein D7S70_21600 [Ralstonia pickettii]|nr:hypothetical protein [Ralstonia pickettii]MBB0037068.1 hypothetical protein [Ralstonia pickettii]MBB0099608.1 hypothetical protein [Ralstonia pickettii]MBB0109403.1 hypothetical protein [Ralstonia pickettii]MBB0130382.1 hypothetical protein [Ralstonia pickettii]
MLICRTRQFDRKGLQQVHLSDAALRGPTQRVAYDRGRQKHSRQGRLVGQRHMDVGARLTDPQL